MFPIGDDQVEGGYKPIFTWLFIGINVLVFLYQLSLGDIGGQEFIEKFAVTPTSILRGEHRYTLITSMFMHGGRLHIIGNMLFLRVFGDNIEARIGNIKFTFFYLVVGIIASFAHVFSDPTSVIPSLGASGAISGVLGAYLVMFPGSRVKMLSPNFASIYYVPAGQFLLYWIGIQLLSGFGSLAGAEDGVAYFAHIGGFVAGLIYGKIMKPSLQDTNGTV